MNENFIKERLQYICKHYKLTPYKLAKDCDLPYSTINTILTGASVPSFPTVLRLCEGLNITVSDFFQSDYDKQDDNDMMKQNLIYLWDSLDDESKKFVIIYMSGLAHKQLREEDMNEKL